MKKKGKLFNLISKTINVFAFLLATFFTWLQFDDISFNPLFTSEGANVMFKITLAIYYFSWVYGCSFDLKDEEYSFVITPNKGKLPLTAFLTIILLSLLFGALCWANTFKRFIILLNTFFIFNIISWRYLVKLVKPILEENKNALKDKFGYEYHKVLKNYLLGNWQWFRFLFGLLIILLLNIAIFMDLISLLSSKYGVSSQSIISIGFFIYVMIFELWIWVKRWERKLTFNIFDNLDEEYTLLKIKNN